MFDPFAQLPLLAPSLLAADAACLADQISAARDGGAGLLHLDIMDGHFVPNLSYGPHIAQRLGQLSLLKQDVHLMVTDPLDFIGAFAVPGVCCITVHYESNSPRAALERIRTLGLKAGLSVKPDVPVANLAPLLELCDLALLMTVYPGFGGQGFLPGSLERIAALRGLLDERKPGCRLQIDGGVNADNVCACVAAGADIIVAGGAVFAPTPRETTRRARVMCERMGVTAKNKVGG